MQYSSNSRRPHPQVNIPPGARPPVNPSPVEQSYAPYAFEVTPAGNIPNPWDDYSYSPSTAHPTPQQQYNNNGFINGFETERPRSRASARTRSVFEPPTEYLAFPEPQIYRSSSTRASPSPSPFPIHRNSRSDVGPSPPPARREPSLRGTPSSSNISIARAGSPTSSIYHNDEFEQSETSISNQMSNINLVEDGLTQFQNSNLPDRDEEWHKLVPPEAQEALGDREVQRQSTLFEVVKSERDYVHDMELIQGVFIQPLREANPPVIKPDKLSGFLSEVFWNINEILDHHQRMLTKLFERQREQHPLVQSVADIILDTSLVWRNAYESYIKHYPLAEARHRSELKRNPRYQAFIQQCSQNPAIRKRDLITFLSRPVTRLPRLSLVLEHIQKLTDKEHPDLESLPLILNILSDFIKSTQPGIAAAESKVKFWGLCESLVYQKGEIIDMDLYDDSRTVVYSGALARRQRSETDWHGWNDYFIALLDNFLVLTREEMRSGQVYRRHVGSRPIPLEFLRLGSFTGASETRKVGADDGRLLESLRFRMKPLYPFTVYHAASKSSRRYTLYAASEALRTKWKEMLDDAIAVYRARQEANMFFLPQVLNDGYFRTVGTRQNYNSGARFSGKVTSAVPFVSGGKRYLAAGCTTGIFVCARNDPRFQRVLPFSNVPTLIALQDFNKFIVQHDATLLCYSLDLLARVASGSAPASSLDASKEQLAGQDGSVLFIRSGRVGNRTLLIFALKKLLQVTIHTLEAVNLAHTMSPTRRSGGSLSFRPFGGPFYIPKDAYDVTPLVKTIAVSTEKGIVIIDPTNMQKSVVTVVPDWREASNNQPMSDLKSKCESSKPLGLVRCDSDDLLVVYDNIGCYITKHGAPTRSSGYIRWETKATNFAHRGNHVLLFSPEFVEVRDVNTGRLVQVLEGAEIRLLHYGPKDTNDTIIMAMKGDKDDNDGVSDKLVEMIETTALARTPSTASSARSIPENLWDEWDM